MGRRKLNMKLIENQESRQVTFCKRRKGIFKKAKELSSLSLTPSHIGILVFSEAGNAYSFGSPSIESVIHGFQDNKGINDEDMDRSLPSLDPELERLRHEYMDMSLQLQKETQSSEHLKMQFTQRSNMALFHHNLFKTTNMGVLSVSQLSHLRDRLIGLRHHLYSHHQLMMMMQSFRDDDDDHERPPTSSNVSEDPSFPSVELIQDSPFQNDGGEHGYPTSPFLPLPDLDLDLDLGDLALGDDDGFMLAGGSWGDDFFLDSDQVVV